MAERMSHEPMAACRNATHCYGCRVAFELTDSLAMILPLAEAYLQSAPSHPDNAKLETARGALADARHLTAPTPMGGVEPITWATDRRISRDGP